jgi:hypothetical protein
MQEMKGSMMFGEAREKIQSPPNWLLPHQYREEGQGRHDRECAEGFCRSSAAIARFQSAPSWMPGGTGPTT